MGSRTINNQEVNVVIEKLRYGRTGRDFQTVDKK